MILKLFCKQSIFSLMDILFKDMREDYRIFENTTHGECEHEHVHGEMEEMEEMEEEEMMEEGEEDEGSGFEEPRMLHSHLRGRCALLSRTMLTRPPRV